MKYIRAIDENFNEILLSKNFKKTYTINYTKKWGTRDWKISFWFGLLGFVFGMIVLGFALSKYNLGYINGVIGFVVFFVWKYFVSRKYEKKIEEVINV